MDSVQRVKMICKERKIAISKLEKSCGFSNGYLNSLTKGKIPYDKMVKIAEFLNVSVSFIAEGVENGDDPIKKGIDIMFMDEKAREYALKISKLDNKDQEKVYEMLDSVMSIIAKNADKRFVKKTDTD